MLYTLQCYIYILYIMQTHFSIDMLVDYVKLFEHSISLSIQKRVYRTYTILSIGTRVFYIIRWPQNLTRNIYIYIYVRVYLYKYTYWSFSGNVPYRMIKFHFAYFSPSTIIIVESRNDLATVHHSIHPSYCYKL